MYTNSLFAFFTAGLAAVATAYTQPKGDTPSGNPIAKPGLNEIIPVGTPYTITWTPTTSTTGTVTLLLLRGPSENVKPLYPIVEAIPNTGTYSWTPSTTLEPDTTRYGIQLIVDADGSYQYTTQFGISNPGYSAVSSSVSSVSSSVSAVASSASSALSSALSSASSVVSSASSVVSSAASAVSSASSIVKAASVNGTSTITSVYVASTRYPMGNSSVITATGSMTIPSSLRVTTTSATGSSVATASSPVSTPAAGAAATGLRVGGALGLVMGLAAMAL